MSLLGSMMSFRAYVPMATSGVNVCAASSYVNRAVNSMNLATEPALPHRHWMRTPLAHTMHPKLSLHRAEPAAALLAPLQALHHASPACASPAVRCPQHPHRAHPLRQETCCGPHRRSYRSTPVKRSRARVSSGFETVLLASEVPAAEATTA